MSKNKTYTLNFEADGSEVHNLAAVMARSYCAETAATFVQPLDDIEKLKQIADFLENVRNNTPHNDPNIWAHVETHKDFRCKTIVAKIPVTLLDIDEETQRIHDSEETKFCNKEVFETQSAAECIVNYRDGRFYLMDGKHRVLGFIYNGIAYVRVVIYINEDLRRNGLTRNEEALFFAQQNEHVSQLSQYEKYAKGLKGGLDDCQEVKRLADKFNLVPSENKKEYGARTLHCLNAFREIITESDAQGIPNMPYWMLNVMHQSNWFTNNPESPLVARAVRAFYHAYKSQLPAVNGNESVLTENAIAVLSQCTYKEINTYAIKYSDNCEYRNGWNTTLSNIVTGVLTADAIHDKLKCEAQNLPLRDPVPTP